jgi:glycosyltransferase involved in cell wall biosynthesis
MHVLITTDTVGGVWTYTQELVGGLVRQGIRVTLVSMGGLPKTEQTAWMEGLWSLNYLPTTFRLEWMQNSEQDVEESQKYLEGLIREVRPDLLHFNQYCYGRVSAGLPRIVVAHSDVVSWWVAVHGEEPADSHWMRWYRDLVSSGLNSADVVVAPSQWMLDSILAHYTRPRFGTVIHNGRDPALFASDVRKENFVLSVGRPWDAGKQVSLLLEQDQSAPVFIVGSQTEPGCTNARQGREVVRPQISWLGEQSPKQLRELYGSASIYAATSRYEPFGLAPVEAAFSRCALIANDISSFRELWGDTALYFLQNDGMDLARSIRRLTGDHRLRQRYADAAHQRACKSFTADRMIAQYARLYQTITAAEQAA